MSTDSRNSESFPPLRRQQFYLVRMIAPAGIEDPRAYLAPHLAEHLAWLHALESDGSLFLSGALRDETGWDGSGTAIIRAESRRHAEEMAASEPFARAGLRANTVCGWQLNEGSINLTLRVMEDSFSIS